jgi:hypothetical protein
MHVRIGVKARAHDNNEAIESVVKLRADTATRYCIQPLLHVGPLPHCDSECR